ncbi:monofunctional biosynthetic peptidoglycan transglycosylase [Pleomorphovibrio marinus]|uniref:monofunctional biosynthetic peptidoglycan transglycosylase n=1 Tax=Pleomorphovibrio marinus TaxID=2164132 RepID=UPI001E5097DF|nr:monofunctional biosynthetic peptidoglycan transglycosylase [Pleomorphovibrio marinus]
MVKLIIGLWLFSTLLLWSYRWVPVTITPLMVQRAMEQVIHTESGFNFTHKWTPLNRISPHMIEAVIAAEDQKFPTHKGFDWEAIEKAREEIASGKRFRGGSTITNQTAKNVFLFPVRNMLRKLVEAYFTIGMEWFWGKERIMEVYLNVIEMGHGIYGIEAASQAYYQKPSAELSRAEAAMIAAILPNPKIWVPTNPTSYLRGRQAWILRNMQQLGKIEL